MIRVAASVECSGAAVEGDPWVPLTVSWGLGPWEGLLYLWLHDPEHGYAELKIDSNSGALYELVVITLPRRSHRSLEEVAAVDISRSPTLRRDMWPAADLRPAPSSTDASVDLTCAMTCSQWEDWTAVWFSDAPVARMIEAGDARVGVSAEDGLVVVAGRLPGGFPKDAAFMWPSAIDAQPSS